MWAVVSITWSLIMAIVIGGSWSFGEFLYKPSAGYHISDWSFGVGVGPLFSSFCGFLTRPASQSTSKGATCQDGERRIGGYSPHHAARAVPGCHAPGARPRPVAARPLRPPPRSGRSGRPQRERCPSPPDPGRSQARPGVGQLRAEPVRSRNSSARLRSVSRYAIARSHCWRRLCEDRPTLTGSRRINQRQTSAVAAFCRANAIRSAFSDRSPGFASAEIACQIALTARGGSVCRRETLYRRSTFSCSLLSLLDD